MRQPLILAGMLMLLSQPLSAQSRKQKELNKETVFITVEDSIKLGTDLYFPDGDGPFSTILVRMPYNINGIGEWGRFHVTWSQAPAGTEATPKFGLLDIPGHVVLDRKGRGKYVGVMLQVEWLFEQWWGEGDWLIWSDKQGWSPSYHGTGSEEYFNSGWCMSDRKADEIFASIDALPVKGSPSDWILKPGGSVILELK